MGVQADDRYHGSEMFRNTPENLCNFKLLVEVTWLHLFLEAEFMLMCRTVTK